MSLGSFFLPTIEIQALEILRPPMTYWCFRGSAGEDTYKYHCTSDVYLMCFSSLQHSHLRVFKMMIMSISGRDGFYAASFYLAEKTNARKWSFACEMEEAESRSKLRKPYIALIYSSATHLRSQKPECDCASTVSGCSFLEL